jgi:D-alanyl-D-alanine carboxypeptidase
LTTGKLFKGLIVLLLATMLGTILAGPSEAATKKRSSTANKPNPLYAAIVIDADTGAVLHEKYADKPLHPASLVKMMTLMMTFDAIEKGTLTMNSRVRISQHANNQPPSKIGLPVGSTIAVKDAIYALVTKSANDISVALGETIAGSESRFVAQMNIRAREIGMTRTNFRNANGLHHPAQVSSARDMAKLSRYLVMNYPKQYKYFSTKNFNYNGTSYHNHNRLMETYKGMDGIKTGYIQPSGFNLAASAVRNNKRVIAVVFGGRTSQSRNAHVAELLDMGFAKLGADGDLRVANLKMIDDALDATSTPAKKVAVLAPVPQRKPVRRDMLQDMGTTGAELAALNSASGNAMNELIGEGDYDPAVAKRFEAGMVAIAALKGNMTEQANEFSVQTQTKTVTTTTPVSYTSQTASRSAQPAPAQDPAGQPDIIMNQNSMGHVMSNDWALQIGAYASRVRSDQALNEALKKLPPSIRSNAKPVIVPMKAGEGWVFRARIRGLSREQAMASCKYFDNCMAISPRSF